MNLWQFLQVAVVSMLLTLLLVAVFKPVLLPLGRWLRWRLFGPGLNAQGIRKREHKHDGR